MTTYRTWIDFLETLAPAGVVKQFTSGPPAALNTADLPASWVDVPRGENQAAYAGVEGGDRRLFVDHWVALEPVAQNIAGANFDAVITMLDSIDAVFVAACGTSPLMGPMTWRSDGRAFVTIGNINYWAIRTSIEGLG